MEADGLIPLTSFYGNLFSFSAMNNDDSVSIDFSFSVIVIVRSQ